MNNPSNPLTLSFTNTDFVARNCYLTTLIKHSHSDPTYSPRHADTLMRTIWPERSRFS